MTQEELKKELKTLEYRMTSVKTTIDFKINELNHYKNTYSELLRSYMNLDRELALLDGRFKLINMNVSGLPKKGPSANKLLSKMTPLQRAKLFEELRI